MSLGSYKEYDADQVSLVYGGVLLDSGFADGEFIRIEKTREQFGTYEGTDGEVTRSKLQSKLHKIRIRLAQSSNGNSVLSAAALLDAKGVNGAGVVPLLILDRQGTTVFSASKAWISKLPEASFDRMAKEREWEITAIVDFRLDGSN